MMSWFKTRFGGLYYWGLLMLVAFLGLRTVLLVSVIRTAGFTFGQVVGVYLWGALFDLVTCFYCFLPLVPLVVLVPDRLFRTAFNRRFGIALYSVGVFALLFDLVAEWIFWDEFAHRFNFIAVDYLVYTHEVVGNIQESYPVKTVLASVAAVTAAIVFFTRKVVLMHQEAPSTLGQRLRVGFVFLLIPLAASLCVKNGLAEFSKNAYANELAKNGLFSLMDAYWKNELDYDEFYPVKDREEAFSGLREMLKSENSHYVSEDAYQVTREVTYPGPERPCNVVLVLVESLSADFLGCFGSQDSITPNLDELAKQSLLFTNLYATGNRTVRGMEAVTMSVPPTPGAAAIRRPGLGKVATIPGIFRQRGYDTAFICPGYAYFDNFADFFSRNDCRVVDRNDFAASEISYSTIWGLCDGDLFRRVLKEADAASARRTPFFYLALTTSNHRPYTYPQEIDIPSGTGRKGAVKYTDHVIGQFLAAARNKPWFDNTVFVIVADHCASSAGKTEVPVACYHIPAFIYAPKIVTPGRYDGLCSQIDLGPTLLGLLRFSYTSNFFGKDVFRDPPNRAFVATYQKLGLLEGGELVVLDVQRGREAYRVAVDDSQTPTEVRPQLLSDAITYYQTASRLLKNHAPDRIVQDPQRATRR
jgi:phosphoglycerol transferase MdoB-like AlkP superfamily enzyme